MAEEVAEARKARRAEAAVRTGWAAEEGLPRGSSGGAPLGKAAAPLRSRSPAGQKQERSELLRCNGPEHRHLHELRPRDAAVRRPPAHLSPRTARAGQKGGKGLKRFPVVGLLLYKQAGGKAQGLLSEDINTGDPPGHNHRAPRRHPLPGHQSPPSALPALRLPPPPH